MVAKDKLYNEALDLRNIQGNLTAALEKVDQILTSDPDCIKARLLKSTLWRDLGEIVKAEEILLDLLKEMSEGNKVFRSDTLRLLGFLKLLQGDKEVAKDLAEQAWQEIEDSDEYEIRANVLALLGNIYHSNNFLSEAEKYYQQALTEAEKVRFVEREVTVSINLAAIAFEQGKFSEALAKLEKVWERTQGKWTKARFNVLFEKIKILRKQGELTEELVKDIKDALQEAESKGWADEAGNLALQLGLVYYDLGYSDMARESLEKSVSIFKKANLINKVEMVEKELKKYFKE